MTPCFRCNGQVLQFQDDLGPRCVQCGRTVSQPPPAPAKNGPWAEPIHERRLKLLPRIDRAIHAHQERKRNA